MATTRPGNQSVLVVVDVQVGVMERAWQASQVIDQVGRAVERAREHGMPVLWVQHESAELVRDSDDWQWVPQLRPADGEGRVYKRYESSFESTDLEDQLARKGATHIVLAGACTNWCIRATAYAALDRGYDLTLLKDAHTTGCIDLGNGQQVEASGMVADLNNTMTWLSYPGRTSATATTEEFDFSMTGPAN